MGTPCPLPPRSAEVRVHSSWWRRCWGPVACVITDMLRLLSVPAAGGSIRVDVQVQAHWQLASELVATGRFWYITGMYIPHQLLASASFQGVVYHLQALGLSQVFRAVRESDDCRRLQVTGTAAANLNVAACLVQMIMFSVVVLDSKSNCLVADFS